MTTIRQIERLWEAGDWKRLSALTLAGRAESAAAAAVLTLGGPVAAAGLALMRACELSAWPTPLRAALIRVIVAAQRADGGFGSSVATAAAVRGLMAAEAEPGRVAAGIASLARTQRDDGGWGTDTAGRLPMDPAATTFVMLALGGDAAFREIVATARAIERLGELAVNDRDLKRTLGVLKLRLMAPARSGTQRVAAAPAA